MGNYSRHFRKLFVVIFSCIIVGILKTFACHFHMHFCGHLLKNSCGIFKGIIDGILAANFVSVNIVLQLQIY